MQQVKCLAARPFNNRDEDAEVSTTRLRVSLARTTSCVVVEFLPAWYFFQGPVKAQGLRTISAVHLGSFVRNDREQVSKQIGGAKARRHFLCVCSGERRWPLRLRSASRSAPCAWRWPPMGIPPRDVAPPDSGAGSMAQDGSGSGKGCGDLDSINVGAKRGAPLTSTDPRDARGVGP